MVIKRNGNKVPYDIEKIKIAVSKAYKEVRPDISDECVRDRATKVSDLVDRIINNKSEDISVEDIQDIVEDVLIGIDNDVAKAYIKYRYKRQMARNTTDNAIMELIGGKSEYWNTENSNKNANIVTTQRDYLAGITSKDITKRFLLPEHIVKADEDGVIHFHDSDYFIQNITNCFHGLTKFVTSEGVRRFDSCYDGEVVKVVDKNGEWKTATVHNYGKQKMQTVTLQSGRSVVKVRCTPNHRWLLKNGSVTTDLKIDDRLALTPYQHNITEINPKMFCLGFVLGDGSDYSEGNSEGVRVRLCGNKTSYLDLFIEAGYKISSVTFDNNDVVCIKNGHSFKNSFIKNHMWRCLTHEDLYSLFEGYYAAGGSKDRCAISTADSDLAMMIDEISSITGRYIISRRTNTTPTNFSDNRILYEFRFIKNTLPNRNWIVKDIDKSDLHEYSAWCVEEPTTNSFTLDSGIVTGNCCLVNLEDMLQNGTVINKKMIEKPHRFLTASTIATQIITAVASSQYGGTSIDISHLAPFVRDSFNYHKDKYIKRGFDDEDAYIYAVQDTQKEVEDGVQTFNYQINSMSTTNGQTPFISVFLYLGDNPEYEEETAMIISEFLRQRIKGIKNEEGIYTTQEFPKLLYVIEESNCMNGGKYDCLTELAAQCTAKRLVPDYISKKKMIEYKNGDVYGCMGCRSFLTVDRFTEKYGNIAKAKNYKPNEHKYWGRSTD